MSIYFLYELVIVGFCVCPFILVAMWFIFRKQIVPTEQATLPMLEKVLIGSLLLCSLILTMLIMS